MNVSPSYFFLDSMKNSIFSLICTRIKFFCFCTNEWDRTIHHMRLFNYNEKLYVIVILKCFEIQVINSLRTGELRTLRNFTML
ncbi:hypothetical protein CON03_02070 [Bacillus cereus]|nr:hypothetical protein CON03_02070 [Bacillus cereus]